MLLETEALENVAVESTKSHPWIFVVIICAAVLAIGGVVAYLLMRRSVKKPFSLLLDKQQTLDMLDGATLYSWAKGTTDDPNSERLVAYANKRWISRLGYQYPSELDEKHNVVACVVDKVNGKTSYECLFSFSEMSPNVKKLFGNEDCFFLRNDRENTGRIQ